MCDPEVTHKKREVRALRRQVCAHITKLRLWQERPYTVAEVTSQPGLGSAQPGDGPEMVETAVAKVGYPDRWWPERGKKVAVGKATKAIALALWDGKLCYNPIETILHRNYIEGLTGVTLETILDDSDRLTPATMENTAPAEPETVTADSIDAMPF